MIDKRDVRTTVDNIREDILILRDVIQEPVAEIGYALATFASNIYYDIKFLFDGTRARARVYNTGLDDDLVGPHQPFIDAIRTHLGWEDNA